MNPPSGILQIGFGNFGPAHLHAWRALGLADGLCVLDTSFAARAIGYLRGLEEALTWDC
jgi:hypothetical protein